MNAGRGPLYAPIGRYLSPILQNSFTMAIFAEKGYLMAKYYSFELNRYLPYFQLIKEYFGISYQQILGSMSILESDPDSEQYVYILEKISIPTLEELFITWHFNGSELIGRSQAISLVYFVANLYYGDNYYRYERSKNS